MKFLSVVSDAAITSHRMLLRKAEGAVRPPAPFTPSPPHPGPRVYSALHVILSPS